MWHNRVSFATPEIVHVKLGSGLGLVTVQCISSTETLVRRLESRHG